MHDVLVTMTEKEKIILFFIFCCIRDSNQLICCWYVMKIMVEVLAHEQAKRYMIIHDVCVFNRTRLINLL